MQEMSLILRCHIHDVCDADRSLFGFDAAEMEFFGDVADASFDFRFVEQPSVRTIIAALALDTSTQTGFAHIRGATPVRQLLLQTPDLDIHLEVESAASSLLGQILEKHTLSF